MTEGISYKKCTYNEEERKMWEKDCRIYRIRQERIKKLAEEKISKIKNSQDLQELKVQFLGKKSYGRPLLRFRNIHLKP